MLTINTYILLLLLLFPGVCGCAPLGCFITRLADWLTGYMALTPWMSDVGPARRCYPSCARGLRSAKINLGMGFGIGMEKGLLGTEKNYI